MQEFTTHDVSCYWMRLIKFMKTLLLMLSKSCLAGRGYTIVHWGTKTFTQSRTLTLPTFSELHGNVHEHRISVAEEGSTTPNHSLPNRMRVYNMFNNFRTWGEGRLRCRISNTYTPTVYSTKITHNTDHIILQIPGLAKPNPMAGPVIGHML